MVASARGGGLSVDLTLLFVRAFTISQLRSYVHSNTRTLKEINQVTNVVKIVSKCCEPWEKCDINAWCRFVIGMTSDNRLFCRSSVI